MPTSPIPPPRRKKGRKSSVPFVIPPGTEPSWKSVGWAPDLSPAGLVDYVSKVVIAGNRDAVMAGNAPSGVPQTPLKSEGQQGRRASRGNRPNARGWTGRKYSYPLKIRRGKLRVTAVRASVVIRPGVKHRAYVTRERNLGRELLSADGDIQKLIQEATDKWMAAALDGSLENPNTGELDADQLPDDGLDHARRAAKKVGSNAEREAKRAARKERERARHAKRNGDEG